ncbi:phosphate signaling complex protein PhoU [Puniceicoccaceae bacterium K14]|nr:phosphate signaling complex protein PhoU [Puniceicoccaceae bacterium K14]
MKRYFHEELENVRSHLMLMGEKAVENVNTTMRALLECDIDRAEQVIKGDDEIDELETLIDEEVARYVSLRSPVARDLRLLFVAIKVSHDLERVGDEATSICKRARKVFASSGGNVDSLANIPRMCEHAIGMLQDALFCFVEEEEERAYGIILRDKQVDTLNRENFAYYIEEMKASPDSLHACTEMIFISKSFERIADHAKNIAEQVYYLLTAESLKEALRE